MLSIPSDVNSIHIMHAAMHNFNNGDFCLNKIYVVDLVYIQVCEVNILYNSLLEICFQKKKSSEGEDNLFLQFCSVLFSVFCKGCFSSLIVLLLVPANHSVHFVISQF
jgi:hypothetical protein